MVGEPRIRVSAILRWNGRILLARHDPALHAVTRDDVERVRREAETARASGA